MLQKKFRGLSALQVSELFEYEGRSTSDRFFHINWRIQEQPYPQFAIITPKKLSLTAVSRNRLRRRVSAVLHDHFSAWTAGMRIAIVVKKAAIDAPPGVFRESLIRLFDSMNPKT